MGLHSYFEAHLIFFLRLKNKDLHVYCSLISNLERRIIFLFVMIYSDIYFIQHLRHPLNAFLYQYCRKHNVEYGVIIHV